MICLIAGVTKSRINRKSLIFTSLLFILHMSDVAEKICLLTHLCYHRPIKKNQNYFYFIKRLEFFMLNIH